MLAIPNAQKLIDIRKVGRSFPKGIGADLVVLENVDLTIKSGEIVGCLAGPARANCTKGHPPHQFIRGRAGISGDDVRGMQGLRELRPIGDAEPPIRIAIARP